MAEQNHRLSSILSCFGLSVSKPINFRFCAVSCYHLSLLNLDRLLGFLEYCQAFEAHLQFVQLDLGNVSGKVASGWPEILGSRKKDSHRHIRRVHECCLDLVSSGSWSIILVEKSDGRLQGGYLWYQFAVGLHLGSCHWLGLARRVIERHLASPLQPHPVLQLYCSHCLYLQKGNSYEPLPSL